MSKITNCFLMLELLNSGSVYSVSKLSTELGVTERMVRYYKEQLELSGFPIESFKGPGGGYFLNKNNSININYFNKYDLEILDRIKEVISDKADGDLTSKIQISGSVNTSRAGTYTITYSVTNSKDLTATVTRTVEVKGTSTSSNTNTNTNTSTNTNTNTSTSTNTNTNTNTSNSTTTDPEPEKPEEPTTPVDSGKGNDNED